jgi:hypothetical protein
MRSGRRRYRGRAADFVDGVVATDVLPDRQRGAVDLEQRRTVQTSGAGEYFLLVA